MADKNGNPHLAELRMLIENKQFLDALRLLETDVECTSNVVLQKFYQHVFLDVDSRDKDLIIALANHALGVMYTKSRKSEERDKALPFFMEAKDSLLKADMRDRRLVADNESVADALLDLQESIAWYYKEKHNYSKQFEYLRHAWTIAEARALKAKLAHLSLQLSSCRLQQGDKKDASSYASEAEDIAQDLERSDIIAESLIAKADVHLAEYYDTFAIDDLEKALKIGQEFDNRLLQLTAHARLCDAYLQFGVDFQQAFDHVSQAFTIAKSLDPDGYQRTRSMILDCFSRAYIQIGNFDKALETLRENRLLLETMGDDVLLCGVETDIASIELQTATTEAEDAFRKVENCFLREIQIADEIEDKVRSLKRTYYYAILHHESPFGNPWRAVSLFRHALETADAMDNLHITCSCHQRLGKIFIQMKDWEQATHHVTEAKRLAREVNTIPVVISSQNLLGYLHYSRGQLKEAKANYLKGIEVADFMSRKLNDDENRIEYFESILEGYTAVKEICIRLKKYEEALLMAERTRARSMVLLMRAQCNDESGSTIAEINSIQAVHEVVNTANVPVVVFDLLKDRLYAWIIEPNKDDVTFIDFGDTCPETDVTKVLQEVSRPRAISSPLPGADRTVPGVNLRCRIPLGGRSVFVRNCLDNAPGVANCHEDTQTPTQPCKMFQKWNDVIMKPVLDVLKRSDTDYSDCIIIPDLQLHLVPFPALLINDNCATVMPSLDILNHSLRKMSPPSTGVGNCPSVLVVGNPLVPEFSVYGEQLSLSDLQGAKEEAILIAEKFNVEPLLGDRAKLSVIKRELPHADVIHVACHGIWSETALVLSPDHEVAAGRALTGQDVFLTADDVMEMKLRAKIVVLSACHSGKGEIKSEGMVGLSRAFLIAGAKAVVVALWKLPDQATKDFMAEFYEHLITGDPVSLALRNVMRSMREQSYIKWASFTIVGLDVKL